MTEDSVQLSVDIANLTPGWSFPTTWVAKEPQNPQTISKSLARQDVLWCMSLRCRLCTNFKPDRFVKWTQLDDLRIWGSLLCRPVVSCLLPKNHSRYMFVSAWVTERRKHFRALACDIALPISFLWLLDTETPRWIVIAILFFLWKLYKTNLYLYVANHQMYVVELSCPECLLAINLWISANKCCSLG